MATVNLGSIKFKWKGTYNGATAYTIDDVVEYNGSSYICKLASTGNLPTNTTYFDVMSQAGTNGTNGTDVGTVITTQGDLLYRDGSGLQRLGAGTAGQVLQTGGAGANPSWTNQAGGTIAQFQFNSSGTNYSNTSQSTYLRATNIKIDITPTSASNKVFVNMNLTIAFNEMDSAFEHELIRIIGGTETTLYTSSSVHHYFYDGQVSGDDYKQNIISYLDTPNTTSAITYVVQFKNPHRTTDIQINRHANDVSYMWAYEINV